jgi:lipoprotein NlpD
MRLPALLAAALLLVACARSTVTRTPDSTASRPAASSLPSGARETVVSRGDTLYGIAFRHGLDWREVARLNGIAPPYTIYPGQRLKLSAGTRPAPATASRPATTTRTAPATREPPRPVASSPPPASQPPATRPAQPAATSPPAASTTPPPASTPPAAPAPAGALRWQWPADGQLISRFVAGDPTRQGIDIAGNAGQPVLAAADGEVVYSGSGLVGYGELIIIKHSDSWLSAYGHNRRRLVNEGERVRGGQQIAEMGRSGASRDMLHFEIRRDGRPVDPLAHLPRR